ncbi:MAG TPA: hypothetical protein VF376_11870 [Thermoanaerobaculia bacterium]
MIRSRRGLTLAWALLLALGATALTAEKIRNHFDTDALFQPPGFFDFVVLGAPSSAQWKVLTGKSAPSPLNYLGQIVPNRPKDSIAAALRRNVNFQDGAWSVMMLRGQGRGGIVFRMADEKDYRVLLVNLGSGEARLVSYEKGMATDLGTAKGVLDRDWCLLQIVAKGPHIVVRFNDKPLIEAVDPTPASGRAGVATAGPGLTSFDEFITDPGSDN